MATYKTRIELGGLWEVRWN